MSNRSTLAILDRARLLLTATGNGELSQLMPRLGFDTAALAHGHELYNTCEQLRVAADNAIGAKEACTTAVTQQTRKVQRQYTRLSRSAKGIFAEDRTALQTLGLVTRRRAVTPAQAADAGDEAAPLAVKHTRRPSEAQSVFLGNARQLYDGALGHPNILAELAKYAYPEARLRQERLDLGTLEAFDAEHERLKAVAKARTAEQQAAVKALQKWMSRFATIVSPALADRPDLLRSMGIKPAGRSAAA